VYEAKSEKIIAVNDAAIAKYGYAKETLLKMKIVDLRATQQEIERSSLVDLFTVLPSKLYEGIYIHKTKKNKLIYMEIVRKSLRVNNTTIRILLANDITDKLEILSKINLQDKSLQEISWIQSHVVRAPIVRILGIIDLMKNEPSLSKKDLNFFLESIFNSATELDVVTRIITNKTKVNP
jgi:PAS domain S-box-containing protein